MGQNIYYVYPHQPRGTDLGTLMVLFQSEKNKLVRHLTLVRSPDPFPWHRCNDKVRLRLRFCLVALSFFLNSHLRFYLPWTFVLFSAGAGIGTTCVDSEIMKSTQKNTWYLTYFWSLLGRHCHLPQSKIWMVSEILSICWSEELLPFKYWTSSVFTSPLYFMFFMDDLSVSSLFDHLKSIFLISTTMVNITQYCKTAPHLHETIALNKASAFHLLFPLLSISSWKINGTRLWKKSRRPSGGEIHVLFIFFRLLCPVSWDQEQLWDLVGAARTAWKRSLGSQGRNGKLSRLIRIVGTWIRNMLVKISNSLE